MLRVVDHLYIVSTLIFTVYSQLIIRWQVSNAGNLPEDFTDKIYFIGQLLINPWILSSILATFFAGVSWMLAMSRFEISYAYPWISINFVLILILGVLLFNESLSGAKLLGTFLIVAGIVLIARN